MNVLIIEDDEAKLRDVISWFEENFSSAHLDTAKSLHTGKEAVLGASYDLVILDMTMRNYERSVVEEGGRPHAFAGREILRQMHRRRISAPVIVVTQFERFGEEEDFTTLAELKKELKQKFPNYVGTVQYRVNVDDWRPALGEMVAAALGEKGTIA